MKNLGKIFINPEKVIKKIDLVSFKGGDYEYHYAICYQGGGEGTYRCAEGEVTSCDYSDLAELCNLQCEPGWSAFCN